MVLIFRKMLGNAKVSFSQYCMFLTLQFKCCHASLSFLFCCTYRKKKKQNTYAEFFFLIDWHDI